MTTLSISKPLFDFSRLNVFHKVPTPGCAHSSSYISDLLQSCKKKERDQSVIEEGNFSGLEILEVYTRRGKRSGLRRSWLEWLPVLTAVIHNPHNSKIFQNRWDLGINWGYTESFMVQWVSTAASAQATAPLLLTCKCLMMLTTHDTITRLNISIQITPSSLVNTFLVSFSNQTLFPLGFQAIKGEKSPRHQQKLSYQKNVKRQVAVSLRLVWLFH